MTSNQPLRQEPVPPWRPARSDATSGSPNATAAVRAKERGRSRMELFENELHDQTALTLQSSTALRGALERGELRVFYQPIVDVDDSRPLAVEALLRWQHPVRGLVSPDEFIHLAEDTGMIVPIGSWALQQALRERAGWEAELPNQAPLRLAVNLSARQLSEPCLLYTSPSPRDGL